MTGSNLSPPHTHTRKHKKYSDSTRIVCVRIRADKEFLQIHNPYVKFSPASRNDWPSNFLENYPKGFYWGFFLNFSPGTSSSPGTLPCHVCARGQITPQIPKSAKFISLFIHSKVLHIYYRLSLQKRTLYPGSRDVSVLNCSVQHNTWQRSYKILTSCRSLRARKAEVSPAITS